MYETERVAFKKWLADHQKHFDALQTPPAVIAYWALKAGFPLVIVREWEQHQRWERTS